MKPQRFLALLLLGAISAQAPLRSTLNVDSLAAEFQSTLKDLTSPALEERKHTRRLLHRTGYASVLSDVLHQDALAAAISFLRTKLHIEYAISHRTLFVYVPIVRGEGRRIALPLDDDWSFPADPWKRE